MQNLLEDYPCLVLLPEMLFEQMDLKRKTGNQNLESNIYIHFNFWIYLAMNLQDFSPLTYSLQADISLIQDFELEFHDPIFIHFDVFCYS